MGDGTSRRPLSSIVHRPTTIAYHLRRHPRHDTVWRHRPRNHAPRGHYRTATDDHSIQKDGPASQPAIFFYDDALAPDSLFAYGSGRILVVVVLAVEVEPLAAQ